MAEVMASLALKLDISDALSELRRWDRAYSSTMARMGRGSGGGSIGGGGSGGGRGGINPNVKASIDAELRYNIDMYRKIFRLHSQALREKARMERAALRDQERIYIARGRLEERFMRETRRNEEGRARIEDRFRKGKLSAERAAYRERDRLLRQETRNQENELRRREMFWRRYQRNAANMFSGGGALGMLQAASTRLGGFMPQGVGSTILRQTVTGSFFGGAAGSGLIRGGVGIGGGAGSLLGRGVGGLFGNSKIGSAIGGTLGTIGGGVLGVGAGIMATSYGASIGASIGVFQTAARTITSAVSRLTRVVSDLVSTSTNIAKRIGIAGVAATAGLTAAGLSARSRREMAMQGLSTVAGSSYGALSGIAERTSGGLFSKTDIMSGMTKGLAFGMSPEDLMTFLPLVRNAAALFGSDLETGLKAIPRAMYQGETELAEAIGLNLREGSVSQLLGKKLNFSKMDPTARANAIKQAALIQLQKFQGAEERITGSLPGSFTAFKSSGENFLSAFGGGFAQGFGLQGRMGKVSNFLGGPQGTGLATRLSTSLGATLGKGADYISSTVLPAAGRFLTSEREGGKADEMGQKFFKFIQDLPDMLRNAKQAAMDFFNAVIAKLQSLWKFLSSGNVFSGFQGQINSLFDQIQSRWNELINNIRSENWPGVFAGLRSALQDSFIGLSETIRKEIIQPAALGVTETVAKSPWSRFGAAAWGGVQGGRLGATGYAVGPVIGTLTTIGGAAAGAYTGYRAPDIVFGNDTPKAQGGFTSGKAHEPVSAVLHGGEYVMPNRHVERFRRAGVMDSISQGRLPGFQDGGFPGMVTFPSFKPAPLTTKYSNPAYNPAMGSRVSTLPKNWKEPFAGFDSELGFVPKLGGAPLATEENLRAIGKGPKVQRDPSIGTWSTPGGSGTRFQSETGGRGAWSKGAWPVNFGNAWTPSGSSSMPGDWVGQRESRFATSIPPIGGIPFDSMGSARPGTQPVRSGSGLRDVIGNLLKNGVPSTPSGPDMSGMEAGIAGAQSILGGFGDSQQALMSSLPRFIGRRKSRSRGGGGGLTVVNHGPVAVNGDMNSKFMSAQAGNP